MALVWMEDYRTRCWNCCGDFFHFFLLRPRVPFFVYRCFPATTDHVSCLKRAKKSSRHEPAWLRANKNHASNMQSARACTVLVRTQPGSRVPCSSCAPTKCVLPLTTYQVGGPSRCAPRVFPGTWKIFQFCFIAWLCPRGKESLQFLFCSGQRLYNYVLLLSLPQREETLQFCFIGSNPKGTDFAILFYRLCPERRDFTILFYWLCPEKRELQHFVLLNLPREKRTLTFLFYWICPERTELYNFVLLALPREKRLYSFDLLGLPQREETLH